MMYMGSTAYNPVATSGYIRNVLISVRKDYGPAWN